MRSCLRPHRPEHDRVHELEVARVEVEVQVDAAPRRACGGRSSSRGGTSRRRGPGPPRAARWPRTRGRCPRSGLSMTFASTLRRPRCGIPRTICSTPEAAAASTSASSIGISAAAALEREALLARVARVQELLEAVRQRQLPQDAQALGRLQRRVVLHRLHALLQPGAPLLVGQAHELDADGVAVGAAQGGDQLAQRALRAALEGLPGDHGARGRPPGSRRTPGRAGAAGAGGRSADRARPRGARRCGGAAPGRRPRPKAGRARPRRAAAGPPARSRRRRCPNPRGPSPGLPGTARTTPRCRRRWRVGWHRAWRPCVPRWLPRGRWQSRTIFACGERAADYHEARGPGTPTRTRGPRPGLPPRWWAGRMRCAPRSGRFHPGPPHAEPRPGGRASGARLGAMTAPRLHFLLAAFPNTTRGPLPRAHDPTPCAGEAHRCAAGCSSPCSSCSSSPPPARPRRRPSSTTPRPRPRATPTG